MRELLRLEKGTVCGSAISSFVPVTWSPYVVPTLVVYIEGECAIVEAIMYRRQGYLPNLTEHGTYMGSIMAVSIMKLV